MYSVTRFVLNNGQEFSSEREAKDENEMGTVEIKSKYALSSVYEGLNP